MLVAVRYFTARVLPEPDGPGKPIRQNTYLEALATRSGLSVHYGYFASRKGGGYEEKMTDVNIAVELLCDAQANLFDTAILISGDSDLTGAVLAARERYGKRVLVAFPPGRRSIVLRGGGSHLLRHRADCAQGQSISESRGWRRGSRAGTPLRLGLE